MKNKKSIAIIDDEEDARQILSTLIERYCLDYEVCGEAESVETGYDMILQKEPDVILLDISMSDGTGFDLLDKFENILFKVIFTTAHDQFALKAFKYHALDYLLKPIQPDALVKSLTKIKLDNHFELEPKITEWLESFKSGNYNKITLKTMEGLVFITLDDIYHLEGDGSYTTFYLKNNEKHLVSRPLKEFEELLPESNFFRTHQSHIINLHAIKKILREDGGSIQLSDGTNIPLARRRKQELLDKVNQIFPSQ